MAADMAEALMLLTRLPVPVRLTRPRGAGASWAWPLAGAAVASLAATVSAAATATGLPPGLAAGLALAALVLLTGALHEDGLADTADGLWGGQTRDRRLEILRDSRIGTYGVVALVLGLGLRWQVMAALAADPGVLAAAMVAAACLSRATMAGVAWALPHARPDGLSAATGRPPAGAVALASALALALALGLAGPVALLAALAAALASAVLARVALARIGGQTGDILGASQQLAEIAGLIALLALRP
jgi:adenosylcobinamide-GDP ribazoletransferase